MTNCGTVCVSGPGLWSKSAGRSDLVFHSMTAMRSGEARMKLYAISILLYAGPKWTAWNYGLRSLGLKDLTTR